MPVPSTSRCAVHPDVVAVEICARCGAFTCAECLEFTPTETPQGFCRACFQREFGTKASGRAVAAIAVAIAAMSLMCLPAGAVAWVLAEQELGAIARGEAPPRGRNLATGARILGIIEVVLSLLILVVVAVLVAAGLRH